MITTTTVPDPPWVATVSIKLFGTSHGTAQDFCTAMKSSSRKTVVFAVVAYFTKQLK